MFPLLQLDYTYEPGTMWTVVTAALAAGGVGTAIAQNWFRDRREQRKFDQSLVGQLMAGMQQQISDMREEIGRLQAKLDTVESDRDKWRTRYDELIKRIEDARKRREQNTQAKVTS